MAMAQRVIVDRPWLDVHEEYETESPGNPWSTSIIND